MNNSHKSISKCNTCGEYSGYTKDPQSVRVYCRCEPQGWELCTRHALHIRRRFKTSRIDSEGRARYFNTYAMMAPCRDETCFKPSRAMYVMVVNSSEDLSLCGVCKQKRGSVQLGDGVGGRFVVYCKCMPEGYQLCHKHSGNVRNLVGTIDPSNIDKPRILGFHYLVAPCAFGHCYKPAKEFYELVKKNHYAIFGIPTWQYSAKLKDFYGDDTIVGNRLKNIYQSDRV